MRKLMLAGAVALAMMGSTASFAGEMVVTEGHIAQFRSALRLTAEQERYWAPIAATLRNIARQQNAESATLTGASLRRVVAAAMPLFRRLDADQKRQAMALARSLGVSSLAAAF